MSDEQAKHQDSHGTLLKAIWAAIGTLIVAGILGGLEIKSQVEILRTRVEVLEQQVEPRSENSKSIAVIKVEIEGMNKKLDKIEAKLDARP